MTIDLKQLHALVDFDSFIWRVGAVTNDEPVENALYTLKQIIEGFKEQFGSIQLFLTGRDNFRTRIATSKPPIPGQLTNGLQLRQRADMTNRIYSAFDPSALGAGLGLMCP